eukprot:UN04938
MQYYTPKNAYLQDGSLVLETKYEPKTMNGITYPWSSGAVTSHNKIYFTYVKWEVRAKLPTPKFLQAWPAIWFQYQSGGCYQEIDLMEQWVGFWNNNVFIHYYWNPENQNTAKCGSANQPTQLDVFPNNGTIVDFSAEFHVWRMEWNKTSVEFWIDNEKVAYIDSSDGTMPYEPAYIIMNTAICGAGWCGGTNNIPKDVTAYMYIDYVRIYELV